MNDATETLQAKLNLETAEIAWSELERFFAQGLLISVDSTLDLIEVACCVAEDDGKQMQSWMSEQLVAPVNDTQARKWHEQGAILWSVVVRPLILVQASGSDK